MNNWQQKNAHGIMGSVLPNSVQLEKAIGPDAIYTGKTNTGDKVLVVMPRLRKSAPPEVSKWMLNRAIANLTGRCPICDSCISAGKDYLHSKIEHENWCVMIGPTEWITQWFVPDTYDDQEAAQL